MVDTVWSRLANKGPKLTEDPEYLMNYRVTKSQVEGVGSVEVLRRLRQLAIERSFETKTALAELERARPPSRRIRRRNGDEIQTRVSGDLRLKLRKFKARLKNLWHNRVLINRELRTRIDKLRDHARKAKTERVKAATEFPGRLRGKASQAERMVRVLTKVRAHRAVKDVYHAAVVAAKQERHYKNKNEKLYNELLRIIAALRPRVITARKGPATVSIKDALAAYQAGNLKP